MPDHLAEGPPLLELRGITKVYATGEERGDTTANAVHALRGVDLTVQRGRSVALLGPSGSGKSTLLQIAGFLSTPSTGSVRLLDRQVDAADRTALARLREAHVGFVFQRFHLLAHLSALDNVALPLRLSGVARRERLSRARALLEKVGLADRTEHRPGQLSGGQQQRVALARALVRDPELVLADEPTGNLDSSSGAEIAGLLLDLPRRGRALILVTHDEDLARSCDAIVRLRDGHLEATNP